MAKLVVSILGSLDGYCAGPGGQLDALPMASAFDLHNLALMRSADTFLFGAKTFPLFESYWPSVDRGSLGEPVPREIAERFETARKLVVSDKLVVAQTSPWANCPVVRRCSAHARVGDLKSRTGKDLVMFGSPILANDLLAHGLVDEFHLLVGNVVLGGGVRTFEPGVSAPFKLLGQRHLANSNIAALHYDCRPL